LQPVKAEHQQRIGQLIADLDGGFEARERAVVALRKEGYQAAPLLRQTLRQKPSVEVRKRIGQLLKELDGVITAPERLRQLRAIEALEHIGTPEALAVVQRMAAGFPGIRETDDAKLTSQRLSKRLAGKTAPQAK
jgi:hypothetical protein